jgi:AcrR family transcriptional regulator
MSEPVKLGRPPRISAADIARAALDLGLDRATINTVAAALGMSPTGLRRHVATQRELVELALLHAVGEAVDSPSESASFLECGLHYARRLFDYFADHPHAIRAHYSGHVPTSPQAALLHETLLVYGLREGLSSAEAHEIWMRITAATIGAAAFRACERALAAAGSSMAATVLEGEDPVRLPTPNLRELAKAEPREFDHFDNVRLTIEGLRVRYAGRLK